MTEYSRAFDFSTASLKFLTCGRGRPRSKRIVTCVIAGVAALAAHADGTDTNIVEQNWNYHAQNTDIIDYHPGFPAAYSGPNSLRDTAEVQDTVSLDLMAGARLWPGAEAFLDGLMWQGFGFSHTEGIEGFPNSESYRVGTKAPNVVIARAFIRQTFGFGGEQETVEDSPTTLAGREDISRVTLTLGKFSVKDIFDNNAYANDGRAQFMNWALVANEAWDYPADSLGYTTGLAVELNQPIWTLRYGFFQVPRISNGLAQDKDYLEAWGMVWEYEQRLNAGEHPGVVRFLAYLNRAHMGSYEDTIDNPALGENITLTREYRSKYGFGINAEQEIIKGLGLFMRLGWSDGQTEAWMYSDVDETATAGVSVNGDFWHRPNDTFGLAGVINGASSIHRKYLSDGGVGILAGDGNLNYDTEQIVETYYSFNVWKTIQFTADYQYVEHPAFNRDRGPVDIFSGRLHVEF